MDGLWGVTHLCKLSFLLSVTSLVSFLTHEGAKLQIPSLLLSYSLADSHPKINSVYPLSLYQDGQDISGEKNQTVELVFL